MKKFKINVKPLELNLNLTFNETQNTVVDNNHEIIFSTENMNHSVIKQVMKKWNTCDDPMNIGLSVIDEYLLNEQRISQDDREVVIDSLYDYLTENL